MPGAGGVKPGRIRGIERQRAFKERNLDKEPDPESNQSPESKLPLICGTCGTAYQFCKSSFVAFSACHWP